MCLSLTEIWFKHCHLQFSFACYRGPGAVCSGGAFGEGFDCGGSDAEQVRVSPISVHLSAPKFHLTHI